MVEIQGGKSMKDHEYVERIDSLFQAVLDIRTDVLSHCLIEYAKAHGAFNFDRYGEAVVRQYHDRVSGFLDQHQSDLAFDSEKVMDMCETLSKRVQELEEQIDIDREVKEWG